MVSDPPSVLLKLQEAEAELAAENWQQAFALYQHLYITEADDANIHAGLGFSAYKLGNFYDAARYFADACLRRQEPHWLLFLTDTLLNLGSPLAAGVLMTCLEEQHPSYETQLTESGMRGRATKAIAEALGLSEEETPAESADTSAEATRAVGQLAELLNDERNDEARILGEDLIQEFPRSTGLLLNLGLAYKRAGRFAEAKSCYFRALQITPNDPAMCANLGNLFIESGHVADAMRFLEASAVGQPNQGIIWSNLTAAYNHLGVMPVEAEFAARKAIALANMKPSILANTHRLLGNALSRQGRGQEALLEFAKGLDPDQEASLTAPLVTTIMDDQQTVKDVTDAHVRYGTFLERKFLSSSASASMSTSALRGAFPENLRIGFMTADFRDHSVSYFAYPLVEHLSKMGHELSAYFNFGRPDGISQRYKSLMNHWRPVRGVPDDDVAQLIRADGIDVLIDLAGHTAGHRLPVFMRRPALLHLTWLGHPATTGISAIDARLTDEVADPVGVEREYVERLIRIPEIFAAYRPLMRAPEQIDSPRYNPQPPPFQKNGFITFGSCNTLAKYSDSTIRMWARVLQAVPNSKLLIEAPGLQAIALQRAVAKRFAVHGIGAERLDLRMRDQSLQYLIYNQIDIALDSFPCGGGTTSFDLLWMGVPLVTLPSDRFAGRMGASLLTALGRSEWVATSEEHFADIAAGLALDPKALAAHRAEQRTRMQSSALMNEAQFAVNFVGAIREAWEDNA